MEVVIARLSLEDRIEAVITGYEVRRENPDRWECNWLSKALASCRASAFSAGDLALGRLLLPQEKRSSQEIARIPPTYRPLTIVEHRANFECYLSSSRRHRDGCE